MYMCMMKRGLRLLPLWAIVACGVASCSQEEAVLSVAPSEADGGEYEYIATAGMQQPDSRLVLDKDKTDSNGKNTLGVTWSTDDNLSVFKSGSSTLYTFQPNEIKDNGHTASFKSTRRYSSKLSSGTYYAVYPAVTSAGTTITLDMTQQKGTLNSQYIYMCGTKTLSSSGTTIDFGALSHLTSVIKLNYYLYIDPLHESGSSKIDEMDITPLIPTDESGSSEGGSDNSDNSSPTDSYDNYTSTVDFGKITSIKITLSGLSTYATYDLSTGAYSNATSEPMTLSDAGGTIYLHVIPTTTETSSTIDVVCTTDKGVEFSSTINSTQTLTTGTMYSATAELTTTGNVHNSTPGSLSGSAIQDMDKLVLSGEFDSRDISTLRGWSDSDNEVRQVLDMTDATITSGGTYYFTPPQTTTKDNEITYAMFWELRIKEIYLPKSITAVGEKVFYYMSHLEKVHFTGTTPPTIASNAFEGVTNYQIIVPNGYGETYKNATNGWEVYKDKIIEEKDLTGGTE